MTKRLEEYIIEYAGKENTIRLYTDGEHRCSCNKFAKQGWADCLHIKALKNNTARLLQARRFQ